MKENRPKHSGFEAPTYGVIVPEGTKWIKNPDGTLTPIYPKEQDGDKDKPEDSTNE